MVDHATAEKGLRDFLGTFAFVKRDMPDWRNLPLDEAALLAQELGWRALTRGRVDALINSTHDSWFRVELNGVQLELPRYTLMTMRHCILAGVDPTLRMLVETKHWERMKSELGPNTLFLDVGAATGAMSVPYALTCEDLRIVAFEPSRRARSYLEATIARNDAQNIDVLPYALSDHSGSFDFMELPEDTSGAIPFQPEASRLFSVEESPFEGAELYRVEVSTIDGLAPQLAFGSAARSVAKIDVEGYEDKVLLGAIETLREWKPFLSIDIHVHPGTTTLTDRACAEILEPLGYHVERMGHVMLAW